MTSTKPEIPSNEDFIQNPDEASEAFPSETKATSATTNDEPAFGWKAYAERINGRFAMIGFLSVLIIEALSHDSFLHWSGLIP